MPSNSMSAVNSEPMCTQNTAHDHTALSSLQNSIDLTQTKFIRGNNDTEVSSLFQKYDNHSNTSRDCRQSFSEEKFTFTNCSRESKVQHIFPTQKTPPTDISQNTTNSSASNTLTANTEAQTLLLHSIQNTPPTHNPTNTTNNSDSINELNASRNFTKVRGKSNLPDINECVSKNTSLFHSTQQDTKSISGSIPLFTKIEHIHASQGASNSIESSKRYCRKRFQGNNFNEALYNSIHNKIASYTSIQEIEKHFQTTIYNTFFSETKKKIDISKGDISEALHLSLYLSSFENIFIIEYLSRTLNSNDREKMQELRNLQIRTMFWGITSDYLVILGAGNIRPDSWLYKTMLEKIRQFCTFPMDSQEHSALLDAILKKEHSILCTLSGRHFLLIEAGLDELEKEFQTLKNSPINHHKSIRNNITSVVQGILVLCASSYKIKPDTEEYYKDPSSSKLVNSYLNSIKNFWQFIDSFGQDKNSSKKHIKKIVQSYQKQKRKLKKIFKKYWIGIENQNAKKTRKIQNEYKDFTNKNTAIFQSDTESARNFEQKTRTCLLELIFLFNRIKNTSTVPYISASKSSVIAKKSSVLSELWNFLKRFFSFNFSRISKVNRNFLNALIMIIIHEREILKKECRPGTPERNSKIHMDKVLALKKEYLKYHTAYKPKQKSPTKNITTLSGLQSSSHCTANLLVLESSSLRTTNFTVQKDIPISTSPITTSPITTSPSEELSPTLFEEKPQETFVINSTRIFLNTIDLQFLIKPAELPYNIKNIDFSAVSPKDNLNALEKLFANYPEFLYKNISIFTEIDKKSKKKILIHIIRNGNQDLLNLLLATPNIETILFETFQDNCPNTLIMEIVSKGLWCSAHQIIANTALTDIKSKILKKLDQLHTFYETLLHTLEQDISQDKVIHIQCLKIWLTQLNAIVTLKQNKEREFLSQIQVIRNQLISALKNNDKQGIERLAREGWHLHPIDLSLHLTEISEEMLWYLEASQPLIFSYYYPQPTEKSFFETPELQNQRDTTGATPIHLFSDPAYPERSEDKKIFLERLHTIHQFSLVTAYHEPSFMIPRSRYTLLENAVDLSTSCLYSEHDDWLKEVRAHSNYWAFIQDQQPFSPPKTFFCQALAQSKSFYSIDSLRENVRSCCASYFDEHIFFSCIRKLNSIESIEELELFFINIAKSMLENSNQTIVYLHYAAFYKATNDILLKNFCDSMHTASRTQLEDFICRYKVFMNLYYFAQVLIMLPLESLLVGVRKSVIAIMSDILESTHKKNISNHDPLINQGILLPLEYIQKIISDILNQLHQELTDDSGDIEKIQTQVQELMIISDIILLYRGNQGTNNTAEQEFINIIHTLSQIDRNLSEKLEKNLPLDGNGKAIILVKIKNIRSTIIEQLKENIRQSSEEYKNVYHSGISACVDSIISQKTSKELRYHQLYQIIPYSNKILFEVLSFFIWNDIQPLSRWDNFKSFFQKKSALTKYGAIKIAYESLQFIVKNRHDLEKKYSKKLAKETTTRNINKILENAKEYLQLSRFYNPSFRNSNVPIADDPQKQLELSFYSILTLQPYPRRPVSEDSTLYEETRNFFDVILRFTLHKESGSLTAQDRISYERKLHFSIKKISSTLGLLQWGYIDPHDQNTPLEKIFTLTPNFVRENSIEIFNTMSIEMKRAVVLNIIQNNNQDLLDILYASGVLSPILFEKINTDKTIFMEILSRGLWYTATQCLKEVIQRVINKNVPPKFLYQLSDFSQQLLDKTRHSKNTLTEKALKNFCKDLEWILHLGKSTDLDVDKQYRDNQDKLKDAIQKNNRKKIKIYAQQGVYLDMSYQEMASTLVHAKKSTLVCVHKLYPFSLAFHYNPTGIVPDSKNITNILQDAADSIHNIDAARKGNIAKNIRYLISLPIIGWYHLDMIHNLTKEKATFFVPTIPDRTITTGLSDFYQVQSSIVI